MCQRPKAKGLAGGNGTDWPSKKLVTEGAIGNRYCVCVVVQSVVFMKDVVRQ
jgi:hypothetical protein